MTVKIEVFDLNEFSVAKRSDLKPGDVYIDDGAFYIHSEVNRHPIFAPISNDRSLHFVDFKPQGRYVAVLRRALSTRLIPLSAPQPLTGQSNLHGCAVVMGEGNQGLGGGAAICASLGENKPPGRIAMFVGTGISEFHEREFTAIFQAWRLEWRNDQGEPVFALTMLPDNR